MNYYYLLLIYYKKKKKKKKKKNKEHSGPFINKVNKRDAPNYYESKN